MPLWGKALFADTLAKRTAEYAVTAIANFHTEFDEPRSNRDKEVGLQFEALALRNAAEAIERRIAAKQYDE